MSIISATALPKNAKIKFSHDYKKLRDCIQCAAVTKATLIEVIKINVNQLSKEFIEYDTDNGKYNLPKSGEYLMLIFKKPFNEIFTTLRAAYPSTKETYYRSMIGKEFEVEISEKQRERFGFKHKTDHED